METTIVSLKSKPTPQATTPSLELAPHTPKLLDKIEFPTETPQGFRPVKRKPDIESGDDERQSESAPIHIHREPAYTRNTQRRSSDRTSERIRPARVSREFEAKFHALEKSQKSLIESTQLEGQLEDLTVSQSSSGEYWIAVEGSGKPFIRMPFATPEFCFECALELEDRFDISRVIGLRAGETFERIEEMVGVWLDRERVAGVWG